jgi:histone deacetylase 11
MNEFLIVPTLQEGQIPILYSPEYNVNHTDMFDGYKFKRIVEALGLSNKVVCPVLLPEEVFDATHIPDYLETLKDPKQVAAILELPIAPANVVAVQRIQTSGTIQAAWLAMEYGWAVNLGGGFHHASATGGHGFCLFTDLSMTVWSLLEGWRGKKARRILIVDLDAHQGDGYEQDLQPEVESGEVYIMDAYNHEIFPARKDLRKWIGCDIRYHPGDEGAGFLRTLTWELPIVMDRFRPDIVLYNAGTDTLVGDPLGGLIQSEQAIKARDLFVFKECQKRGVKICMTLSGGYTPQSATVIADSLRAILPPEGCLAMPDVPSQEFETPQTPPVLSEGHLAGLAE